MQFIREGNVVYPMHRPASALVDFAKLSLGYVNTRHRFLPPAIARRIMPAPNHSPPYDTTHIIDTHLAVIEDFVRTAWAARGQRVDDYFFDAVHYLQPGHALAGRTVAAYLLRNGLAAP